MKNVFILIVVLILPFTYCQGQERDYYNEKTDKVEVSPKNYIDYSIIASEALRMQEVIKRQDSIIKAKDVTIQEISQIAKDRLTRIEELVNVVIEKNKEVDDISEDQIDIASGLFSKLRLSIEANTDPMAWENIMFSGRLRYDLKKVYIFTQGDIGKVNQLRTGIGLTIF